MAIFQFHTFDSAVCPDASKIVFSRDFHFDEKTPVALLIQGDRRRPPGQGPYLS
jgi:hypothetical protein